MSLRIFLLMCCALSSTAALAAAPDLDALTKPCAECHGPAGVSNLPNTPHLNGQLATYLEEDIAGLAKGGRASAIPNHVPKTWTGPEIAAVAKFYAASKAPRPVQVTDPQMVAKGQVTYQKRCADCHPNNGRDSDHDAPLLAAQNVDYLMEQARHFVSGKRKFVFMMDEAFAGLTPAELDAVAHFLASQDQFKK